MDKFYMADDETMSEAKKLQSVEELIVFAKEHGIDMNADEAAQCFAYIHTQGELSEEELENVAGGGSCGVKTPVPEQKCPMCGSKDIEIFDEILAVAIKAKKKTYTCKKCNYGWYPYQH